ncbi:hypothetical protein BU14_0033s0081 [Porphyra umbilicalis]|uniref:Cytochrome P450 n=1 Tax=Porphyra umbilicalis TaxID=2786 RepID=A0A1X6PIS1_PORUM|nr:hypothetical protein BU14_0033s0081 [Porphyra umbilicalis]|eukprot:OSX80737.1 hypothetical protein BU14_0033s0081 [Porphyra umbilicalis]
MEAFLAFSAATAGDALSAKAPASPSFGTAVGATLLLLLLSSVVLYTYTRRPPPTGIAGPPPYPFVGNVFHIDAHNLPKSFNALHTTYGRVVKLHLGPRVMVSVADAGLAEAIFTASRGGWSNSDLFRFVFGPLYPRSAIVIEGSPWRRIRRLLHSAVAGGGGGGAWPSGKEGALPMTRAAVDRGLGRLTAAAMADAAGSPSGPDGDGADGGMPVDTMAWSQEILFESLGGYAFGEDWRLYADDAPPQGATISAKAASTAAAETADAGSTVAAEAADATAPPSTHRPLFEAMYAITQGLPRRISRPWRLWWSLPTAENRRVWAAQATIRAEFERILARRRAARVAARAAGAPPLPPVPLLDVLLDAGGDTGDAPPPVDPISEADIMDNAVTIAFAGTDTTAATLAFVFYHLATHPKVQADLVAEIETVTAADGRGDGDSDTGSTNPRGAAAARGGRRHPRKQLNATELEALPLLSAVVSESSRLLPTSFAIPRTPRKQFTHGDMVIPAGTLVIINVLRMGQDEGLWPPPSPGVTPADFCVERWLGPDGGGGKRTAYAHLPFGAGDRSCLGRPVALSQVKAIVVQVLGAGWELLPVPGRELKLAIRMALVPEGGAWLNFRRRRA